MTRWIAVAFAGVVICAVVSFGAVALTRGADPRVEECGAAPKENVQAIFNVPRARDIWQHIPKFGRSPELEDNDLPASVVVFSGPIEVKYPGRPNPDGPTVPTIADNIVCVLIGGVPTYYGNIDLSVLRP